MQQYLSKITYGGGVELGTFYADVLNQLKIKFKIKMGADAPAAAGPAAACTTNPTATVQSTGIMPVTHALLDGACFVGIVGIVLQFPIVSV